uniref:Peptidase A1 domain-containing protein n=1 Tax=Oryza brachyantha TaxID=4533 RepID=J3LC71_ORYBR
MTRLAVRALLLLFLAVASPFLVSPAAAAAGGAKLNASSSSPLYGIEFPPFNAGVADGGCDGKMVAQEVEEEVVVLSRSPSLKLHMTHRSAAEAAAAGRTRKESFLDSAEKDLARIHTMLRRRVAKQGGQRATGAAANPSPRRALTERIVATVESGVAVGSGEYLVDVYVGTPPRRFQMIMDTGSDLNWLQCAPCLDCFEQRGPVFDPAASVSYHNLRAVYGHAFSYCLVDHGSSVGSKIVFGDDDALLGHPRLNYTAFSPPAAASAGDTFYYVQLKGVLVGGEMLSISASTWDVAKDGSGGTIIDSGTTLSYFAEPAYQVIRQAFIDRMNKAYPLIADFPVLNPCYNVSGVDRVEVPEFSLLFADGAVWDFPAENYFIRLDPEGIMCLAVLGTPRSAMSIIGNFQQQNFHVLYDLQNNQLGFAPRRCAEV